MTTAVLTIDEIAARWQCNHKLVRSLIKCGRLAAVNIGSGTRPTWRVSAEIVEAFERTATNQKSTPRRRRARG